MNIAIAELIAVVVASGVSFAALQNVRKSALNVVHKPPFQVSSAAGNK